MSGSDGQKSILHDTFQFLILLKRMERRRSEAVFCLFKDISSVLVLQQTGEDIEGWRGEWYIM